MVFFSYTAFTSGGEAKWKINQQHASIYFKFFRIIHQIAFVLQVVFHIVLLSQEYATQDVYLLLKEKLSNSHAPSFFQRKPTDFPPIRGTCISF